MTVLEMAQDILSDMNSDSVNSINDTTESLQVAQILQSTYFNIIDGKHWPWLKELYQLTGLGLTTKPTHMQIPSNIIEVEWIKYNTRKLTDTRDYYTTIKYKTPEDFVEYLSLRNSSDSNTLVVTDYSNTPLNIITNKAPQYYTSFDDNYIVFDSYLSDVEDSMQTSKTQCYGRRYPTFTMSDTFVADLPVQMFSYFLNEAKSTCFLTLKQAQNQKAEQNSISQRRRMSQDAWKTAKGIKYPNYGRK